MGFTIRICKYVRLDLLLDISVSAGCALGQN